MPFDNLPIALPLTPHQIEALEKERRYYARKHESVLREMATAAWIEAVKVNNATR